MSSKLFIYKQSVVELLQRLGYTLGYTAIGRGTLDVNQSDFYFRGTSVIRISSLTLFVSDIKFCGSDVTLRLHDVTMKSLKEDLARNLKSDVLRVPSLLSTFEDVLFNRYESPDKKLTLLTEASQDFHPDFLKIFESELKAMRATTELKAQFNLYDVLLCESKYFMVVGKSNTQLAVHPVGSASLSDYKLVSLGEIANGSKWKLTEPDNVLREQESLFKTVCSNIRFLLDGSALYNWIGEKCPSLPKEMLGEPCTIYKVKSSFINVSFEVAPSVRLSISNDLCFFDSSLVGITDEEILTVTSDRLQEMIKEAIFKYAINQERRRETALDVIASLIRLIAITFELYLYKTEQLNMFVNLSNSLHAMAKLEPEDIEDMHDLGSQ